MNFDISCRRFLCESPTQLLKLPGVKTLLLEGDPLIREEFSFLIKDWLWGELTFVV